MIILNRKLIHLNLNNTGLNEDILNMLIPELKQSVSLMGVHLSNNPGISEEVISNFRNSLTSLTENIEHINFPNFEEEQVKNNNIIEEFLST